MAILLDLSSFNEDSKDKKMAWQETMTKLEDAVKVAQEKEEKLTDATAAFTTAKDEYSKAVADVENLRAELNNLVGNLFQNNPKVRQFS